MTKVAYVGGSITKLAVRGAHALGPTSLWRAYDTGGGTLSAWDRYPKYFSRFDAQVIRQGKPTAVWLQLCHTDDDTRTYSTPDARLVLARRVLAATRQRVGDVPIYVSAMAGYNPVTSCQQVLASPPLMAELAGSLVIAGDCLAGPVLPTLTADQVVSDGCHQNTAGQQAHGSILRAFFP